MDPVLLSTPIPWTYLPGQTSHYAFFVISRSSVLGLQPVMGYMTTQLMRDKECDILLATL